MSKKNTNIELLKEEISKLEFAKDYYKDQYEASKTIIFLLIGVCVFILLSHFV